MNNFYEFIKKDIESKKNLLSTLPTKTKTNKRKYNQELEKIRKKYDEYRLSTRNYLVAKSKKIDIKDNREDVDKLKKKILELNNVKFLLNPTNTYLEKMGFDELLYKINNFDTFNFDSLNDIINGFLDKFSLVGILLTGDDFDYTCYVHEYMTSYLKASRSASKDYSKVSEIFEQIYWVNPDLIHHIELNFRKLIKINEKKFTNYIVELQKEVMEKNGITNYAACLEKLQEQYIDLNLYKRENVSDIIELSKKNVINIEQYMPGNKVRTMAFMSLIPEGIDYSDNKTMKKICFSLEKLRDNIDEFNNYLLFEPLFLNFKEEYEKLIPTGDKKEEYKGLKLVLDEIEKKENELDKLNKKIFGGRPGLFEFKNDNDLKKLKAESVIKAKELYDLYRKYDEEYFKDKVMSILSNTLTVSDLLNLYYSFDYLKKLVIQKVFKLTDYDSIVRHSKEFDEFAMNPTNVIVTGIPVFESVNIPRIIANKYRLNNIKMTEEDLSPENLKILENKLLLILRVDKKNSSNITIDDVWFISQVDKIIEKENKNANV